MYNLFLMNINKYFNKIKFDNKYKTFYKNSKSILSMKGKL